VNVDAPARVAAGDLEVELLTQSAALRTALRRAFHADGGRIRLCDPHGVAGPRVDLDVGRRKALVLDAEMPGLTGAALAERIASTRPGVPVLVVAGDTARAKALRERTIAAGAAGFFLRPVCDEPRLLKPVALEVLAALKERAARPSPRAAAQQAASPVRPLQIRTPRLQPKILVIASSTGGPQALLTLFGAFGPENVGIPVLVVQHMPAAFTPILAEHLSRATRWRAREGTDGERLVPGEIRIAPGGRHMLIGGPRTAPSLTLSDEAPVNFCRPSADVLFFSAAERFGSRVQALVLTGMGHDGAAGAKAIKAAGGLVYAQDEASSIVWGMPGAAVAAGAVDRVLPLETLAPALRDAVSGAA